MTAMDADAIPALLAGLAPVGCHAPWRRFDVDAQTWTAIARSLGAGKADLLGLWGDAAGGLVAHPLAVVANIFGKPLRALPTAKFTMFCIGPRCRVHRRATCKFRRNLYQSLSD
jgi:hypothetical protein